MDEGYTIDHIVNSGKLITVFSAPDYPQFQVTSYSLYSVLFSVSILHLCNYPFSLVQTLKLTDAIDCGLWIVLECSRYLCALKIGILQRKIMFTYLMAIQIF